MAALCLAQEWTENRSSSDEQGTGVAACLRSPSSKLLQRENLLYCETLVCCLVDSYKPIRRRVGLRFLNRARNLGEGSEKQFGASISDQPTHPPSVMAGVCKSPAVKTRLFRRSYQDFINGHAITL